MYCIEILPKLRSLVQDAPSLDSDPASQMSKLHASRHSRLALSYVVQIDRDRLYRMLVLAKRVTLTLKPKSPTGEDDKNTTRASTSCWAYSSSASSFKLRVANVTPLRLHIDVGTSKCINKYWLYEM